MTLSFYKFMFVACLMMASMVGCGTQAPELPSTTPDSVAAQDRTPVDEDDSDARVSTPPEDGGPPPVDVAVVTQPDASSTVDDTATVTDAGADASTIDDTSVDVEVSTHDVPVVVDPCDQDGDGRYSTRCTGGDDCDDHNPLTYPGAPEICDGIDENCDGNPDLPRMVRGAFGPMSVSDRAALAWCQSHDPGTASYRAIPEASCVPTGASLCTFNVVPVPHGSTLVTFEAFTCQGWLPSSRWIAESWSPSTHVTTHNICNN